MVAGDWLASASEWAGSDCTLANGLGVTGTLPPAGIDSLSFRQVHKDIENFILYE